MSDDEWSNQTDSSYYSFSNGDYTRAADARAQQQSGPSKGPFRNGEQLDLTTPGTTPDGKTKPEWQHKPLIPGTDQPWSKGQTPGPHRSVWTDPDPSEFDVMTHDKSAGTSARGYGKFVKGEYRPKKADRK